MQTTQNPQAKFSHAFSLNFTLETSNDVESVTATELRAALQARINTLDAEENILAATEQYDTMELEF